MKHWRMIDTSISIIKLQKMWTCAYVQFILCKTYKIMLDHLLRFLRYWLYIHIQNNTDIDPERQTLLRVWVISKCLSSRYRIVVSDRDNVKNSNSAWGAEKKAAKGWQTIYIARSYCVQPTIFFWKELKILRPKEYWWDYGRCFPKDDGYYW